ncbi:MAG: hypothetical protein COB53_01230 [Elusimicrobia bacterium]|nr:MAG: hypothetical protein COB53_01230 [Elusimicrobiota bacterium]
MNRLLRLFCIITISAGAALAAPSPNDIAKHARKSFSLSPLWKVNISPLKKSELPGFLSGTMSIVAPEGKQDQPIYVSEDGQWYFLGTPHNIAVDPDKDRVSKMKLTGVPGTGPANAALTMVEYSDLQCPHCKHSHDILKEKLGPYKGKIRRIFKNFPLRNMHKWANAGAVALACVGKIAPKQAAAFKSHVFAAQGDINEKNADSKLKAIALKTGLPEKSFNQCYDKKESQALVEADIAEGDRLGVRGTPSIFINGRRVRGYTWAEVEATLKAMSK